MSQSIKVHLLKKTLRSFKSFKTRTFVLVLLVSCLFTLFLLCSLGNQQKATTVPVSQQRVIEWLRNKKNLRFYVRPDQNTVVVAPSNVEAVGVKEFIACFVMSAPKNKLARYTIRKTWGREIKPIFLIGIGDRDTMDAVNHEAEIFNDIIIEDFTDSYANLTLKTAFAMKNFLTYFEHSKYFLKIDDDVYLNVDNLYKSVAKASNSSIICRVSSHAKPVRDATEKWYIPAFLYPSNEFPPYCIGQAYMIPGHLIRSIFKKSMDTPYLNIEDVFFTGVVAGNMLNYSLHDAKKFKFNPSYHQWTCLYEDHITIHRMLPHDQVQVWNDFQQNKKCNPIQKIIAFFERRQEIKYDID